MKLTNEGREVRGMARNDCHKTSRHLATLAEGVQEGRAARSARPGAPRIPSSVRVLSVRPRNLFVACLEGFAVQRGRSQAEDWWGTGNAYGFRRKFESMQLENQVTTGDDLGRERSFQSFLNATNHGTKVLHQQTRCVLFHCPEEE